MKHNSKSILDTYQMITDGKMTNAHFSDDEVVMVSKKHYYSLISLTEALEIIRNTPNELGCDKGFEWLRALKAVEEAFKSAYDDET